MDDHHVALQHHPRPKSASQISDDSPIRRSVAASYLDLRPLPGDAVLSGKVSFDSSLGTADISGDRSVDNRSVDRSVDFSVDRSVRSWMQEEEHIRRRLHERLPSTRSRKKEMSMGQSLNRPSTAPQAGIAGIAGIKNKSREELLAASASARSARYLAIQWRSRATQLNLSKSMSNVVKEAAPSPTRVSDESESDSEDESSQSDVSCGTMDESIKSQVSDAQKVVEKWQQRWYERTDSQSFDATASRDEEDERDRMIHEESPCASAETLKRSGSGSGSRPGSRSSPELESDELGFAFKPSLLGRKLITTENDQVEILSALKPYPLPALDSGKEFYSDPQHHVKSILDSDSEDDEMCTVERRGILILAEGGRVMETVAEGPITRSQELDKEQTAASIGTNDENLSHSACSNHDDNDHLSESSATQRTLSPTMIENDTQDKPVDNSRQSIVQTFCNVPETLQHPQHREQERQPSFSDESTINTKESSVVTYTGSVQERIEAVKKARSASTTKANNKQQQTSSSPITVSSSSRGHKRTRRAGTAAKKNTDSQPERKPIKWQEHNIVFTFGLLTSYEDAPPTGVYSSEDDEYLPYKEKLQTKSKLTYEILSNFANIARRTKALVNGSMKYMMISKDCTPKPVSAQRDAKYKAPANRPKIIRSIVKATVPVYVPKDDLQAKEIATHVILDLFSVSISKGEFSGLRFEKIP